MSEDSDLFKAVRALVENKDFGKATVGLSENYHFTTDAGAEELKKHHVTVFPIEDTAIGSVVAKRVGAHNLGHFTHMVVIESLRERLGGFAEYTRATEGSVTVGGTPSGLGSGGWGRGSDSTH